MKVQGTMDRIILDQIPFDVDEVALMDILRISPGSLNAAKFSTLFKEAREIAVPKAVYTMAEAQMLQGNAVEIGGVQFQSPLLCVNLEKAGTVFPFAATCGIELEEWSKKMHNVMHAFWADAIMLMALGCAVNRLEACLKEKVGSEALSSMNPGSLPEWPIGEQANIFALLGKKAAAVGIRLTKNMIIRPQKSISGIYFVSENGFCNCSLCPRERCFARRTPYKDYSKYIK
jgi:hypothetical protein